MVLISLQGLAEDLARWFFQQLIVALDFCHKKGIANRDIKLEVKHCAGSLAKHTRCCQVQRPKERPPACCRQRHPIKTLAAEMVSGMR
jgi:serine/threonine protein kinase